MPKTDFAGRGRLSFAFGRDWIMRGGMRTANVCGLFLVGFRAALNVLPPKAVFIHK
ncbi:MAG: hypothetical protein ACTTKL_10245 [Treponema sp.]